MSGTWPNLLRNGYSVSAIHALPEMDTVDAIDTLVMLTVSNVTGAPTTARLSAQFEVLQPTSQGSTTEANPGGIWTPLDADLHAALLPDGDWPQSIADQTTASTAITGVTLTSGSTAVTAGSGTPFVVGQRVQGSDIAAGTSNRVEAIGGGGATATLRYPAISSDGAGTMTLLTSPVTVLRRLVAVPFWRLVLLPTFSGGTSPAFVVTVSTMTRY